MMPMVMRSFAAIRRVTLLLAQLVMILGSVAAPPRAATLFIKDLREIRDADEGFFFRGISSSFA
jgi:hypothetical protein